ncbi:MAG TPA: hypothetical protein VHT51_18025 [Micropepsaceae bacterium]|jgi:hypothetical protein|nr:hypothetical protein [Micropepsaceae bacterium]
MMTALLILHGLIAVALLGAITHQALAVSAGRGEPRTRSFIARFRATDASAYGTPVVILYIAVMLLGAILYPRYRFLVRPLLQTLDLRRANGAFELKEHFSALGLMLLPGYWAVWKQPLMPEYAAARLWLTWLVALAVWWNFLTGQSLVAIKGLFP